MRGFMCAKEPIKLKRFRETTQHAQLMVLKKVVQHYKCSIRVMYISVVDGIICVQFLKLWNKLQL